MINGIIDSNIKIVTDGLMLNLDASQLNSYPGSGNTWYDVSGNGRHFNWTAAPTFGNDGVAYFSALGTRCQGPASNSFGITNTSGYTIFLVMKQLTLQTARSFKFYSSNGTGTAGRGIFSNCSFSDGLIYLDQGGLTNRTSVASGGLTAWNVIAFRSTTTAVRSIFKNTSLLVTNSLPPLAMNLTTTAMDLATTDEGGTWDARINGFMVYNRALSDAEIAQNYNATKSRFGL